MLSKNSSLIYIFLTFFPKLMESSKNHFIMKAAIYPGTFDPPTVGHLDVARRAAKKFDKLIVAIGKNPSKGSVIFSLEERLSFFKQITKDISNIEITFFEGLLIDFAKAKEVNVIVRAIRTILDFEYETQQAQINRQLGNIETFYLVVDEKLRLISSTFVREIASYGKPLTGFVPPEIEEYVFQRLRK